MCEQFPLTRHLQDSTPTLIQLTWHQSTVPAGLLRPPAQPSERRLNTIGGQVLLITSVALFSQTKQKSGHKGVLRTSLCGANRTQRHVVPVLAARELQCKIPCFAHAHSHSHSHAAVQGQGNGHSHSHNHAAVHGHDHGHSHSHDAVEGHGNGHGHSHSHAAIEGLGNGHSHSHTSTGCGGCGHAHGEIPSWLPERGFFLRLIDVCRQPLSMAISAALFFLSLLMPWPLLRFAGPASVFTVCGLPLALESMGAFELDIHALTVVAAFASVLIGHAAEGALLLLLFAVSHAMEERISMEASASLDALSRLSPEVAHRVPAEQSGLGASEGEEVRVAALRPGDHIMVRAGEVVPVDGEVLDGNSSLGMDHLTGEPLPQSISRGAVAMSGAKNVDGPLLLKVLRPASESTIQRIIRLTSSAKGSRPQLVTFLDAIGKTWSTFVIASTAVIATIPLLFGWSTGDALYRALVWLITASPCALLLATPLVYVATISMAASNGVLLKGGRVLDALSLANGVAFDKTGTITTGAPELQRVVCVGEIDEARRPAYEKVGLQLASAMGQLSVHPVSRAAAMSAQKHGTPPAVKSFQLVAGSGVHGYVTMPDGESLEVAFGKPSFVAQLLGKHDKNLSTTLSANCDSTSRDPGSDGSVVAALAAVPQEPTEESQPQAWLFLLGDRIKESASVALPKIDPKLPLYMLTGDRHENAHRVAEELKPKVQFEEVTAGLSPEEKLEKVRHYDAALQHAAAEADGWRVLQALGVSTGGLVMVGDGVNDAPALAAARVGISLASQADGAMPNNAIASSDVIVLRRAGDPTGDSDLERVEWILSVAHEARNLMAQNLFIAMMSILGASVYTLTAGLPLWVGVLVHEGATVLVALNSLRIFNHRAR